MAYLDIYRTGLSFRGGQPERRVGDSAPDFGDQPAVANGASDMLVEIFGDKGRHARSAVGMASLPSGVCIEIEMMSRSRTRPDPDSEV